MTNPGFGFTCMTIVSLTTGTAFIMWLGEQITERGIGNGMSLIIFTGIVVGLPRAINEIVSKIQTGDWNAFHLIIILAMMVAVVGFIVLVERGERRIPVQYAKRVIGRRMMGGQSTHLPLEGQRRRRDSGDLRQLPAGVSADADAGGFRQELAGAVRHAGRDPRARSRCTICCTPC